MKKYLKRLLPGLCILSAILSGNALGLTLSEARSEGRVGETLDGYLVALKADAQTQTLVTDVNAARRASYEQLAQSHNLPPDEVAKMAGQKLVDKAKPGEYVQGINGRWLQK